jgi:rubredoxin
MTFIASLAAQSYCQYIHKALHGPAECDETSGTSSLNVNKQTRQVRVKRLLVEL